MNFGLPMLLSLEPQERVTVIAHELALAVNSDPQRGFFVHHALRFLHHLWSVLRPDEIMPAEAGAFGILGLPVNLALLLLSFLPLGLLQLLLLLSGEASQRAEYHADLLAARVSGTDTALTGFDKLDLGHLYDFSLHTHRMQPRHPHVFAELLHQLKNYPAHRWEELREQLTREHSRLDASYPPTMYRMVVVGAHPQQPMVLLTPERTARIEAELAPFIPSLARGAYDDYRERIDS